MSTTVRRGKVEVDRRGGEGAKGVIKVSGVVIYIINGKSDQGPTTGSPSHDHGDQAGRNLKRFHLALQGSLRCHLNVIFVSKQPRAFVLPN
jgi:hypothetical protein